MRLFNHLPHPKYFFILGFLGICFSIVLLFATFREQISGYYPYWSPHGTRLAFLAEEDSGAYELFVISVDGTNLHQLTTQTTTYMQVRWSADSQSIYYVIAPFSNNATWHHIMIYPQLFNRLPLTGNQEIDPNLNPIDSETAIEASVSTNSESENYYAISACNYASPLGDSWYGALDECEKTLEVYSVETGELIWSFGKYRYNLARYGIWGLVSPNVMFSASVTVFGLGIIIAILRAFRQADTRKRKVKTEEK